MPSGKQIFAKLAGLKVRHIVHLGIFERSEQLKKIVVYGCGRKLLRGDTKRKWVRFTNTRTDIVRMKND